MGLRLRTKLTLAYLLPVLAVSLVAGLLAYRAANRALEDELGHRLSGIAESVVAYFEATRDGGRLERLDFDPESIVRARLNELLEAFRDRTNVRRIFVIRQPPDAVSPVSLLDTNGAIQPGSELFELEPDRAELSALFSGQAEHANSILFTDEDGSRYLNGYAVLRTEGRPVAVVGVAGSAAYFDTLDTYRTALLALGLLVALLVVLVSLAVSHRLTRPIGRLVDAIRLYGRGQLKEPVQVTTGDEIGFLAEAFNDMRGRLDRRDEQMQLMLSGIAHEVRNPLAGMSLFCSLLRDELAELPEQRDQVDKIARELDYLDRVVNDFLRYARRRPLSPERFSAGELVDEVVEGLASLAADRDVELDVEVQHGLELTGEREALRGSVSNLVQNAIQACRRGGRVRLHVSGRGERRQLVISDTGVGISTDHVDKVFEPFFTTKEQGTGLGLALVHKTIREHSGDIRVESEAGEGTTFTIDLPFDTDLNPLLHEPEYETAGDDIEMIG